MRKRKLMKVLPELISYGVTITGFVLWLALKTNSFVAIAAIAFFAGILFTAIRELQSGTRM